MQRKYLCGLLICAATSFAAIALAETSAREYNVEIPQQPIQAALQELSKQTGVNVSLVIKSKDHNSLLVSPVSGRHTLESALNVLLAPSGLVFTRVNEMTVAVTEKSSRKPHTNETVAADRPHLQRLADRRFVEERVDERPATGSVALLMHAQMDSTRNLEEVIVTAQKRQESLQAVPISISVLGGVDLDRSTVEGVTEALSRVPGVGLNVTYQGGGTQLAVRGVTASGALFNGSSPIAYYLDSVPFGLIRQAIGPDLNAFDLDRVEVLRGPQGTLYGASAQNGVVRVLSKDADLNQLELKGRTSGSSTKNGDESYRGDAAINVPIIEGKLAARAVVGYQDTGGWIDRPNKQDANDAEIRNLRLKLNAQPTDELSIGLSAWASRADYGMPSVADDSGRHGALKDEPVSTDFDTYGLKIGYDFPSFSILGMTGSLDYTNDGILDTNVSIPGSSGQTRLDAKVFSQEIVLNSTSERSWRWTVGGMYRDAKERLYQAFQVNGAPLTAAPTDQAYLSESFAVFGEITRLLWDGRFELTGGLRYFEDVVLGREDSRLTGAPANQLVRSDDRFDALSPRAVLTWHPSSDSTIYASYAEGFRSGFGQTGGLLATAPQFSPVSADTLNNYELGAKGRFFDDRVSFDAAVYYIDWQDVQQSLLVPVVLSSGLVGNVTAVVNSESASGVGFDLGLTGRPGGGFEVGLSVSWNDLAMDTNVLSGNVVLFYEGDRLNISPEFTASTFADYVFPIGRGGLQGRFSTSASYTSEMDLRTIVSGARRIAHGDPMLIARASFAIDSAQWAATFFVDNLGNEQGSPVRFPYSTLFTDLNAHVRPRTLGVQLEYRFE